MAAFFAPFPVATASCCADVSSFVQFRYQVALRPSCKTCNAILTPGRAFVWLIV
jgi:hypothetical protein